MAGSIRSRLQKALYVAVSLAVVLFAFLTWYKSHYSMGVAQSFEVNAPQSAPEVLIATQGSEFKDAVVTGLVAHLRARPAYVKVIDVSALPGVSEGEWSAIVLIHTWEMRRPPAEAKALVDRIGNARKLVVLTTSGAGDGRMEGVDAISSASRMEDVPARIAQIAGKVDAVLNAQAHP